MRRVLFAVAVLLAVSLGLTTTAVAQDVIADLSGTSARANRANRATPLLAGGPSRAETVRSFLRGRHDQATLAELVETREHDFRGIGHVNFGQRVAGLDVYGTYVKASFSASGDLVDVVENLVPTSRALRPSQVGPEAALRAVLARYYPGAVADLRETSTVGNVSTFERRGPFDEAPTVTRVAVPLRGSILDSGYLVVTWDRDNVLRHTVVSGRGQIVFDELRTNADTYRVFTDNPNVTPQQLITGPAPSTASPNGWLGTSTTTIGNNVDAYLDRDNNNAADSTNGRPVSATQQFDYVFNTGITPTDATNQNAAVTNLFYLNNVLHDRLYVYGFIEGAGNFQTSNFGRGGVGNDPVNAEAQDGGGTNNANFATPGDGARPRMQMYLWTTTNPNRDGDVDSDIVYHEYGHGLTWRMIGNMSGPFAGAIGEGMSDTLAIYFNGDDKVGEYSTNNPTRGIRSAPYTNYQRTYGDHTGGTSVHSNGEIYAATMWRLRQLWLAKGWSHDTLLRYIVDGMNYTISRPANEDMRDGILASISNLPTELNVQAARCTVWEAFAQFGVGDGANGVEIPFSVTESFAMPAECTTPPANTAPQVNITSPANGTSVLQGTSVTFNGTANDNEQGSLTSSLSWVSSRDGVIGSGGTFSKNNLSVGTHMVTASVTDGGGLTGSATVTVTVTAPPTSITLSVNAFKQKGVRMATLTWSGASGAVTIYRNNAVVTNASTSPYTDTIPGRGSGSFTYRVCNAGTSVCSNDVTVTY